ncbi:T9SS type A sorting domain-containing protein [Luteibaculum oceani]|uniref:T9SS type A sorting domain-containing protein n=1 Tax=Luteibaculum oceani TaxID=1294296 RepID=A0A5C6VF00_9FLAO|nr:T9SS type A sorting domain-containing protein [Luteibaculum oceani]TXC81798.1 T9SS type A sorting domain-containing protein [Luteibaculum oceani]
MKPYISLLVSLCFVLIGQAQNKSTNKTGISKAKIQKSTLTPSQMLNLGREASALSSESARKSATVFYEYNFDDDLNGWTNDTAYRPSTALKFYSWEHDIDSSLWSEHGSMEMRSQTPKGFAAFEVERQTKENGTGDPTTHEAWAAFKSPIMDLTNVPKEEIQNLYIRINNVYRHCCSIYLEMKLEISLDGGNTYLPNSMDVIRKDGMGGASFSRNMSTSADNLTFLPVGAELIPNNSAEFNQVVFRFVWASTPDLNGQQSDYYYWGIDDFTLYLRPEVDLVIEEAHYGNPNLGWDFKKLPQDFIKDYVMAVKVKNYGSQEAFFRSYVLLHNKALNKTIIDSSEERSLTSFGSTYFTLPTFTSYTNTEDYKGEWTITHFIKASKSTPDGFVNALDTMKAPSIWVTHDIWAHAGPWNGDVLLSPADSNGVKAKPLPIGQIIQLPQNVSSTVITGIGVALHDSTGDPNSKITVPNKLSFSISDDYDFNAAPDAMYYNEETGETSGYIELSAENRSNRLNQVGDKDVKYITGGIYNLNNDSYELKISSFNRYAIFVNPDEKINYCVEGANYDRASVMYGDFGTNGESWYQTDQNLMFELTIKTSTTDIANNEEKEFSLEQNIPNPFKGITEIAYTLNTSKTVSFTIMDITGKIVDKRNFKPQNGGKNIISVDASNYNSGIYFYTLTVDGESITKKMIVNK